jgi:hypothetical protein
VQCALARGGISRSQRKSLATRERELLAKIALPGQVWSRGFLEHARFALDALQPHEIAQHYRTLRSLVIDDIEVEVDEDGAEATWRGRVSLIKDVFDALPHDRIVAFAARPILWESGDELDTIHSYAEELVQLLSTTTTLAALESLTIDQTSFSDVEALRPLGAFQFLERLRVGGVAWSWRTAVDVMDMLPRIRHLGLRNAPPDFELAPFFERLEPGRMLSFELGAYLGERGVADMLRSPDALRSIEHLALEDETHDGLAALLPALPALTNLELLGTVPDDAFVALRKTRVRRLFIDTSWILSGFSRTAVESLASMQMLERLEVPFRVPGLELLEALLPDVRIGFPQRDRHAR